MHQIRRALGMAMEEQPTVETARLILRPFALEDAPAVLEYAAHREVAATTVSIPHPYTLEMAQEWIESIAESVGEGRLVNFAITVRDGDTLIGAIDLRLNADHHVGDLGYAIGPAHWGLGYVTEAAQAVVEFGFDTLELNRIQAHHFSVNESSGKVIKKIGMLYEGTMRENVCKWDEFHDTVHYAILRNDYEAGKMKA